MKDYDLDALYEAYHTAKQDEGAPFAPWSLFQEAYDGEAAQDFLAALDDGAITVHTQQAGIRADGQWPRFHTGLLWLNFDFSKGEN